MKKRNLIIVSISVIAVVVIVATVIGIWYFTSKTFLKDIDANEIKTISVFNGSTGKRFDIDKEEEIEYIVNNIQGIEMERGGISSYTDGFSYQLSFEDKNGDVVDNLIVNGTHTLRKDPFFYNTQDGGICYGYLQALEFKYTDLPERPQEDTTLEFWITENIEDVNLELYQAVDAYYWVGNVFYEAGYSSQIDDKGDVILPEHYVIYHYSQYPLHDTSGSIDYPPNSDGSEYIVGIEITDPEVMLYGLTVNCTEEEFEEHFTKLGFEIRNHDKSEYNVERWAVKDGVKIVYLRSYTKKTFCVCPMIDE